MPLTTRTLNDDEQEHLDDHNGPIKDIVDAYENTDPGDFATAVHSHNASAIPFAPAGTIAASNVQSAVLEAASDAASALGAHLTDTTDAHDATAISMTAVGGIVETNVQDGFQNVEVRLAAAEAAIPSLGGSALKYGIIWMDDPTYVGASDSATYIAITNAIAAMTYRPAVGFPYKGSNWVLNSTCKGRAFYNGLTWVGAGGGRTQSPELNSQNRQPLVEVELDFDSDGIGLHHQLAGAGEAWEISVINISLTCNRGSVGTSSACFMTRATTGTNGIHIGRYENVSAAGLTSIIGTNAVPMAVTVFDWTGSTNNHCNDTAVSLGGSDIRLFQNGLALFDAPAANHPAGNSRPHVQLSYCDKTELGPIYPTCISKWYGLLVHGPVIDGNAGGNIGYVNAWGGTYGGKRYDDSPCFGAAIRQTGGYLNMWGPWIANSMTNTASSGLSDVAYVECKGGKMQLHSPHIDLASGQNPTVVYLAHVANGAKLTVRDADSASSNVTWGANKPRVLTDSGSVSRLDDSVTEV